MTLVEEHWKRTLYILCILLYLYASSKCIIIRLRRDKYRYFPATKLILFHVIYIGPFYTPVFRRVVLWYGDVCPSVRLGLRPGLRQSQFSALFSFMP